MLRIVSIIAVTAACTGLVMADEPPEIRSLSTEVSVRAGRSFGLIRGVSIHDQEANTHYQSANPWEPMVVKVRISGVLPPQSEFAIDPGSELRWETNRFSQFGSRGNHAAVAFWGDDPEDPTKKHPVHIGWCEGGIETSGDFLMEFQMDVPRMRTPLLRTGNPDKPFTQYYFNRMAGKWLTLFRVYVPQWAAPGVYPILFEVEDAAGQIVERVIELEIRE